KRPHMHGAFDHLAVEHAVGQTGRGVGTFVVGHVITAADIEHREPLLADLERLNTVRRDFSFCADAHDVVRHLALSSELIVRVAARGFPYIAIPWPSYASPLDDGRHA